MNEGIVINQSLDSNQIAKANILVLITSKLKYFMILVSVAIIFNLIVNIMNPFGVKESSQIDLKEFLPILILILVPYFIWNSLKKSAQKAHLEKRRFFENVNYIFDTTEFKIEGENFNNVYNWNELKKIKETKNWFLIFTNDYQAVALDKNQQKKEKIEELKKFLNSLNIQKSLK
ncbi:MULTISPECIES: YcxB family protein [Flavobacterium]|uniref:YcxB-like C-terminal domain-containing protein n=1 Tax=Flavobacterium hankyongi TaxID=1176532 RepID=A0ABP8ZUK2_9FLAO|nr:YcxB family protein [Flavobacterium sp. N1846]